jgi:short-subunit dehydrogenase
MKATQSRIVLTGASGGIGRAAADELARSGAALMLVGRSAAQLEAQARALGRQATWQVCDLSDAAALTALAGAAAAWQANVLVHGAGVPAFGRLESIDAAHMQQVLATNLLAPMLLTRSLLPHLRTQRETQVLCIGSALGRLGLPGYSVYSASKFGLRGFAEALRRELADSPVRVKYLGPRSTRTAFNEAAVEAYNRATGTAMDAPEHVARALVALLESDAAEAFVGFPEKLAVRLNGIAPTWLDGAFAKHRAQLPPTAAVPDGPTRTPSETALTGTAT